jgi:glycosyltransferase involved in cell wall biosynthesis
LKIVHVLSLSAIGGVQNSFLSYYELATKKSQFVHEICLTRKIGKDFKSSIQLNYYNLRSITGIIKLIYQIVSKNTVVHFYNSLGSRPIYFLLKILPYSKIIFHERGSAWNSDSSNNRYFYKNAKISEKIISNSNATRQFLNLKFNIPIDKISVIYNGIEFKNKNSSSKSSSKFSKKFSVGYLGRFETQKGLPSLISTAKLLPKINFYFGGYGPWEAYLKEHSLDQKNIFIVGKIIDSFSFLSKIDIFVVPSIREPFGNVIVEAGLCNRTVIASNVDGIPEIINSEEVGFLINPTEDINYNLRPLESLNYPEKVYYPNANKLGKPMELDSKSLAKTIQKLSEDKVLRDKMGKSLNKRVTHLFSLDNYFKNLEQFYINIQ